jgi:hypothetical protein
MALNKEVLKVNLLKMIQDLRKQTEQDDNAYADALAAVIHNYILTITVSGTTTSACTAGGAVGTFTGTVS